MSELRIKTAKVFEPLLSDARYKAIYGGRGSGKSHFYAGACVEEFIMKPDTRFLCVRETQKSIQESSKKVIADKISEFNAGYLFDVQDKVIKSHAGGLISFVGMKDHTAESVKSYEGYDRAWIEEAQSLSATSLKLLRPTIRAAGSQIWFGWNPRFKRDPVDELFRSSKRDDAIVVRANWSDNPWFPAELEAERVAWLKSEPDTYGNVWDGEYVRVYKGAYYAQALSDAQKQWRIGNVSADPLLQLRAYWDIGGTGARSDATAIWIVQFVGREIRVLDYYEAQGQPMAEHVHWLRSKGYEKALQVLPHDGGQHEKIERRTYESELRDSGFQVRVMGNVGAGAAMIRINAARRLLPSMWFNATTTEGGRDALVAYHEKQDEERGIGLGPNHDWSSHAADAFGAMALDYEPPVKHSSKPLNYNRKGIR